MLNFWGRIIVLGCAFGILLEGGVGIWEIIVEQETELETEKYKLLGAL